MSEITQILDAVAAGDRQAAAQLLPLVYAELRRLAAARLRSESPGQTLQPTDLVHEAYLRLVGASDDPRWNGRSHFFAAASQAMRRILVESARRKGRVKHGGEMQRVEIDEVDVPVRLPPEQVLALDEALTRLAATDPEAARWWTCTSSRGCRSRTPPRPWASPGPARTASGPTRAWLRCEIGVEGPAW